MTERNSYNVVLILVLALVVIGAVVYFNQPANSPTMAERIDNATEEMGDGMRDAAREMDPNRTNADRVTDAVNDAAQDVKDAVQ